MPFTDVLNEGYFGMDPQVPNDRINYQGLNWNQFATNLLEPNNGVLTNCFTATSQFHQLEPPTNFSIESCLNKAFYVCTKPIPGNASQSIQAANQLKSDSNIIVTKIYLPDLSRIILGHKLSGVNMQQKIV